MPVNSNGMHSEIIELQDISKSKEKALISKKQVIDTDSFYQFYWDINQRQLYKNDANILDLYKACQYLLTAASMGNQKAKAALRTKTNHSLANDFNKVLDKEFSFRLEEYNSDSEYYSVAQNSLFLLYYSRRYHRTYSRYSERFNDIFQSLTRLSNCQGSLDPNLLKFSKEFLGNSSDNFNYELLKSSTWKILINELMGHDPLLSIALTNMPKAKQIPQMGSPYPFRILSEKAFKAELEQLIKNEPKVLDLISEQYRAHIEKHAIMKSAAKNGNNYHITISAELLTNISKDFIYISRGIIKPGIAGTGVTAGRVYVPALTGTRQ